MIEAGLFRPSGRARRRVRNAPVPSNSSRRWGLISRFRVRRRQTAALSGSVLVRPVDMTTPRIRPRGAIAISARSTASHNRLGHSCRAALDKPEMIGRAQVHEPPGDRAVMRVLAPAAQHPVSPSRGQLGPATQNEAQVEIVNQPEIGHSPPRSANARSNADWSTAHARCIGDRVHGRPMPPNSLSEMNMSVSV